MECGQASGTSESKLKEKEAETCKECGVNPPKYKCPGCSLRSCSLPCVNAHKHRTGCSGKRDVTSFVPLSQFNDNILLSDYNLLEETKRVAESAKRTRTKLCPYSSFCLSEPRKTLLSAAARRRIELLFLPPGMSKRERNRTFYRGKRKKFILWTIEWRFHSTDVVLVDHGVHEGSNIYKVIQKHLKPGPWGHKLHRFCAEQLESLKFFIQKYPKGSKSPYKELDLMLPLKEQLANLVILEYPEIHVFLPSHKCSFEIVRDDNQLGHTSVKHSSPAIKSPKGIPFRVEEIEEENGCEEPKVVDFMKHAGSSSVHEVLNQKLVGEATCNLEVLDDMDFDFDQGLIDAYSDLIAEINPDDFLDLEGEIIGGVKSNERAMGIIEDELEEGEIAE